ncbi:MAG TPA: nicotinamide riboside transporter PnuC [Candidatus Limnocylindria bacterium]|nr:nicotinamide riboside transporter PnuC [Candidatus Limnocylindria bacterium]
MNIHDWIEPIAVVTGIAGVALTVRQHILNWPVGIFSSALFLVLFVQAGLYADTALQVVYVVLGFYGWWHWLHGGPRRDDLPVTALPRRTGIALAFLAIAMTIGFGAFLSTTDDPLPYPDAATTALSLTAQYLLTRKHIENWPVWIFGVNIPYVAIYLYKGLAMTAALQLVFIALSIAGWVAWRRSINERPAPAADRVAPGVAA